MGGNRIKIEHPECQIATTDKKVKLSRKVEKTYRVTVTYVQCSADEAALKKAIIESVIKKSLG